MYDLDALIFVSRLRRPSCPPAATGARSGAGMVGLILPRLARP